MVCLVRFGYLAGLFGDDAFFFLDICCLVSLGVGGVLVLPVSFVLCVFIWCVVGGGAFCVLSLWVCWRSWCLCVFVRPYCVFSLSCRLWGFGCLLALNRTNQCEHAFDFCCWRRLYLCG